MLVKTQFHKGSKQMKYMQWVNKQLNQSECVLNKSHKTPYLYMYWRQSNKTHTYK